MLPLWVRVDLGAIAMKGVFQIPHSSKAGASPLDCLMSYPGNSEVDILPVREMQSDRAVYIVSEEFLDQII